MASFKVQISTVRTMVLILCAVSVLVSVSCGSKAQSVNYEVAKVYLVAQGPTPGQSGNFWEGLSGTHVSRHPWGGGPTDANGMFYMAADANKFYIRMDISDCAPQTRSVNMNPADHWNGTSLQIFFGTSLKRRVEYQEGDFGLNFWVVDANEEVIEDLDLEEEGDEMLSDQPVPGGFVPYDPADLKVMVSKGRPMNERQYEAAVVEWREDGYIIEAAFDRENILGIYKPFKANQAVMCEFRINHAKYGEDRSVIVNWRTNTDDAWRNPSTWSLGVVEKK